MKVIVDLNKLPSGRLQIAVKRSGPGVSTGAAMTYREQSDVIRVLEIFGFSRVVISNALNLLSEIGPRELVHLPEADIAPALLREHGFLAV